MAQRPHWGIALLALIVLAPAARSQGVHCVVYSLKELGDDPALGKWIAETIPQVIAPTTWKATDLQYYAPKSILVVRHTPPVQAEVRQFLDNLKAAAASETTKTAAAPATDSAVVQAYYSPVSGFAPAPLTPSPGTAPRQQPRHRFHFSILYEGEGIIDSNVVEFVKAQNGGSCCQPSVTREIVSDPLRGNWSASPSTQYEPAPVPLEPAPPEPQAPSLASGTGSAVQPEQMRKAPQDEDGGKPDERR